MEKLSLLAGPHPKALKRDLKSKRILLDWIEKQVPIMASRRGVTSIHDTEVIQNQGPADSRDDDDSSLHSGSSKVNGQTRQQPVLLPSPESEFSKPISRKGILSPQTDNIPPHKANESAKAPATTPSLFRHRSKRVAMLKENNVQVCISEVSTLHSLSVDQSGSGLPKTTKSNSSRGKTIHQPAHKSKAKPAWASRQSATAQKYAGFEETREVLCWLAISSVFYL